MPVALPKKHMSIAEMQLVDKTMRAGGGTVTGACALVNAARQRAKQCAPLAFSTIYRFTRGEHHKMGASEKRGKAKMLTPKSKLKLEQARKRLIKNADSEERVTYDDIIQEADLDVEPSNRVVAEYFRKEAGVMYRKPRDKVHLSDKDVATRFERAKQWVKRPSGYWKRNVHCYLDNKSFCLPLTAAQRKQLRQTKVTGHLRKKSEGVKRGFVKAKTKHSFIGMPSVNISAAVAKDRVIMWHVNKKWCGQAAVDMYKGPLLASLRRTWGAKDSFTVVEDGDRAGFQTKAAKKAKAEAGMTSMTLPPRTPAWMPLDYAVWTEIEKKVLATAPTRTESRAAYMLRLAKCAKTLKKGFVAKSIASMHRRIQEVVDAKGFHGKRD
jgi:hypothetical protein